MGLLETVRPMKTPITSLALIITLTLFRLLYFPLTWIYEDRFILLIWVLWGLLDYDFIIRILDYNQRRNKNEI